MVYRVWIYSAAAEAEAPFGLISWLCTGCIVFMFEHGWYYKVLSNFPEEGTCSECRGAFGEQKGRPRQHERTGVFVLSSAFTAPESLSSH